MIRCTFFSPADCKRSGQASVLVDGERKTAVAAEMQADPFVDITYAESVGNFQIHVFISEVCVEFVRICAPACISHTDAESVFFFPCAQKDSNARVLARNAVAD